METFQNQIDPISFLSQSCWFAGRIGKPYFCLENLSWGWKWEGDANLQRGCLEAVSIFVLSGCSYTYQARSEERKGRGGNHFAQNLCSPHECSHRYTATCIGTDRRCIPRSKQIWCLLLVGDYRTTKTMRRVRVRLGTHDPARHIRSRYVISPFQRLREMDLKFKASLQNLVSKTGKES